MIGNNVVCKTSFTDWMNKGFIGKYNDNNPEMSTQMAKPLLLANGVVLSVQASRYHYSTPKKNAPVADYDYYTAFELGFPTEKLPEEFTQYAEDADYLLDTVYAYVPKELIAAYIESVGGVVGLFDQENGKLCTDSYTDLKMLKKS